MSKLFRKLNLNYTNSFLSPEKESKYYNSFVQSSGLQRQKLKILEDDANNFVSQEIKRAKNLGFFDPTSPTNRNIFIDNDIIFPEYQTVLSEIAPLKEKEKKLYSKNTMIKQTEGKNLIISNSQSQYPIKTYKSNYSIFNRDSFKNCCFNLKDKADYEKNSVFSKNNSSNRGIVDFNKVSQSVIFYNNKNLKNTISFSYNQNTNNDKKFETNYLNSEYYDEAKSTNSNKTVKFLMDGYRNKLFKLFIEHLHILFKKYKKNHFFIFKSKIKNMNKVKNRYKTTIITLNKPKKSSSKNLTNKRYKNSSCFSACNPFNRNTDSDNFSRFSDSSSKKIMIFKKKIIMNNNGSNKKNIENKNLNTVCNINQTKNTSIKNIKNLKLKLDFDNTKLNYADKNTNILNMNNFYTELTNNTNSDLNNNKNKNNSNYQKEIISNKKRKPMTIIITKKVPKHQFKQVKTPVSNNFAKTNGNFKTTHLSGDVAFPLLNNKFQGIFNYISKDKKIQISTKYCVFKKKIKRPLYKKHIGPEISSFSYNLFKIDKNCNINILSENIYKKNSNNIVNICENNNSNNLNKGILLLDNLITSNYEKNLNNSDNSIDAELLSSNKEDGLIKINKQKNIQIKLSRLINYIENKNNILLINKYFNIYKTNIQTYNDNNEIDDSQIRNVSIISDDCSLHSEKSLISINSSSKRNSIVPKLSTGRLPSVSSRGRNFTDKKLINGRSSSNKKRISYDKIGKDSGNISDGTDIKSNKVIRIGSCEELIKKNSNESFYEFYSKCEDFIFSFRLQLICCFLRRKNNEEDSSLENC